MLPYPSEYEECTRLFSPFEQWSPCMVFAWSWLQSWDPGSVLTPQRSSAGVNWCWLLLSPEVTDLMRYLLTFQSVPFLYLIGLDCIEFMCEGFIQILIQFSFVEIYEIGLTPLGDKRLKHLFYTTVVLDSFSDTCVSFFFCDQASFSWIDRILAAKPERMNRNYI